MAFTKERRERIKNYILEKIFDKDDDFINKTMLNFGTSLNSIYRYLRELEEEKKLEKLMRGKYILSHTTNRFSYDLTEGKLEEHIIYYNDIEPVVSRLPNNVKRIWEYSFMEMFNNIIDHSEAKNAKCVISQNSLYTWINLYDDGIGIFKKIKEYYNYPSIDDAISSLFKGKLTTDSENHSGEGIFFTSRVLDVFGALSCNKVFSHNNTMEELKDVEDTIGFGKWKDKKGTLIIMALSNNSTKNLREVFDMFSDEEGGFIKTQIPIKNLCENGYPVSRSQAKRVSLGFDKFQKVILDFNGVEDIGQGFAHELFVVYKKNHPGIELIVENANESVLKMINHVKS